MMKKTVQGLVALAVLLSIAGAARARDFQNINFDVFALGGGSTFIDPQYFTSAERLFHSRFEIGPKFTIGVAAPYGKLLTIESAYSSGPNNMVVTNTNVFPHVGRLYPVNFYSGSLSAVFRAPFSFRHLQPYGEAGVEYDRYSPTREAITLALNEGFGAVSTADINHNDKFGMNLGIGVDRKISKRLKFRVDLRDHITGSPAFGLPPQPTSGNAATYPVSGHAHNLEYTAGIVLHLGK